MISLNLDLLIHYQQLLIKVGRTNRTSRVEGAVELIYHLERTNASLLLPYVGSFVKFLGQLIEENNGNTKVIIHLLEVHDVLLGSFLSPQSAQKQQNAIVQNLLDIGLDAKAQVIKFFNFSEVLNLISHLCSDLL